MQQKKNTILTTSTANGRAAHTIPTLMKRITMMLVLIVSFALGARAAQYVFYNANYGYYLALNGTNLERTDTFNPSTCVWTGPDGNSGTFSIKSGNRTYYLRYSNGLTTTTNNNNATAWTIDNNKVYYSSSRYYIRYSNSSKAFQARNNDSQNKILYKCVLESVAASSGEKSYTVSLTSVTANPAVLDYNKSTTVTANGGSVTITTTTTPAHTKYTLTPNSGSGTTINWYKEGNNTATQTSPVRQTTSSDAVSGYEWAVSPSNYTTLGNATTTTNTNTVTYSTASGTNTTVTLSATAYYTEGGQTYKSTAVNTTLTLNEKKDNPKGISAQPLTLAVDEEKTISYTLTPSNAHDNIAYSGYDGSIISITNGVVKGLKAGITEVTLTAKKQDNSDGPSTKVQVTVTPKAPTIEFALGANITATISTTETGAKIYYTTDGTTPTTNSSSEYTAPVSVAAGATVKAIVVVTANGTPLTSPVAEALANAESGIVGNTVYLYDLEDHNWSYYQSDSPISSPNPRNVKITYEGNGGAVGIDAPNQVNFVYYKTLESEGNNYPYTTIANPFSKRPSEGSGNSKTYKGFKAWRVKSITGGSITNYAVNSEIPAETDINFVFSGTYSTNCISAEIILEAVWTTAYVVRCSVGDINNNLNNATLQGSSYETNFIVVNSGNSSSTAINANTQKSVTITMVEPDGSEDYRNSSRYINPQTITLNNALKFEYINMNNNNTTINANAMNLVLGRGIANTTLESVCANYIRGIGGNKTSSLNYQLRIESGIYNYLSFVAGRSGGGSNQGTTHSCSGTSNLVKGILGCDYDRSTTTNSLLKVQQEIIMGYYPTFAEGNENRETLRVIARSGDFTSAKNNDIADADESFYLSLGGDQTYVGRRTLIIEGGQFLSIAGGIDEENPSDALSVYIRMKGGIVRGAIYGSGAFAATSGHRKIVVTGGIVRGWIAAGCNGTSTNQSGGILPSDTYVYVGGNATVGYKDGTTIKINTSEGGNVFGAGSGNSSQAETGRVNNSTVVIADDAYIQKNVYGGGNYGYTQSTANVLVAGGVINGSVFGGSNQKQGAMINLTTTGGEILGGVYGGSNVTGTISGNVTMQINGGQVGTSSAPANIHGGGYGQNTIVTGNVNLTLGTSGQTSEGVTVWGDVYGGSALGKVNCTVNYNNNYQYTNNTETNVTLYKGTINGSLYGGALGGSNVGTHVYGPVKVKVYGGSVKKTSADGSGGVYGANNKDGAPQRSVTVDIYGTDPAPEENQYALHAVYGGGNQAPYTYGNGYPKVTVHNCDNSIEYVYGGGNAAEVAATDVTIYGGDVIGNVFGGGNGTVSAANVTGSTSTKIYGGTILNVYGGSNSQGTIGGDINLLVNSQAEEGKDLCLMNIVNVFGGGNQAASKAGNISIVCTGDKGYIENVYGGANQANIEGNIDLYINGGNIGNVFGGNNESGNISGNITVTVGNAPNEDCGIFEIGNVYGGGNLAAYSNGNGYPIVNMLGGTVREAIFGGGYGESAIVTGNPQVNVSGGIVGSVITIDGIQTILGDIYGGGNMAPLNGNPVVTLSDNANVWSRVFGGGNNAQVTGNTNVTMSGGVVGYTEKVGERDVVRGGDIFGGGNAATIEGETNVHITNGRIGHNVYGGGNEGDVTGKTNVKVGE